MQNREVKCLACGKFVIFTSKGEGIEECPECGQHFKDGYELPETRYTKKEEENINEKFNRVKARTAEDSDKEFPVHSPS